MARIDLTTMSLSMSHVIRCAKVMEKVHVSFIFLSAAVLSESALCEEKRLKDDYTGYNFHGP